MCQDNLCNDFGLTGNATTETPVTMTTTNNTLTCYYGLERNSSTPETWQTQICGPMETGCLTIHNDDGFSMRNCYDFRWIERISEFEGRLLFTGTMMASTTSQVVMSQVNIVGITSVTMEHCVSVTVRCAMIQDSPHHLHIQRHQAVDWSVGMAPSLHMVIPRT